MLLLLCLLSFALGFLSVALYVSWQQAVHLRTHWASASPQWRHIGIQKVIELAEKELPCAVKYDKRLTGAGNIDEQLQKVLGFALRDYFERWYHPLISPDPVCVLHARELAHHVIREFADRSKQIDFLTLFVQAADDTVEHIRQYKRALSEARSQSCSEAVETVFFATEGEHCKDPWKAVCCSKTARQAYFQRVTEVLLYMLLPREDFSNPALQVLLRDLMVCQIWLPLLRSLTQSDNINHLIITMCKDAALNAESFSTALNEGASETELGALRTQLHTHISHLKQTGITDIDKHKLSVFESLLETAEQQKQNSLHSEEESEDSSKEEEEMELPTITATIPRYAISQDGPSKHVVYHVHMVCSHDDDTTVLDTITYRRYRDFHDLDLTLRKQLSVVPPSLSVQPLHQFNKLDGQRLEPRRRALEAYLGGVTAATFLKSSPHAVRPVIRFLTEDMYKRSSTELKRMVDTLKQPFRKGAGSFFTQQPQPSPSPSLPSRGDGGGGGGGSRGSSPKPSPFASPNPLKRLTLLGGGGGGGGGGNSDEDVDTLPVDILLALLDEVFDLREGSHLLRRQLPTVLKQLAGDKISRKMATLTDWFTSPEQIAEYIRDLGNTLWPGGYPASTGRPEDSDTRAIRALLARAKLCGSAPDDLRRVIGGDTTTRGMTRLCGMLQKEALNTRLVLQQLEGLLVSLFPNRRSLRATLRTLRVEVSSKYCSENNDL